MNFSIELHKKFVCIKIEIRNFAIFIIFIEYFFTFGTYHNCVYHVININPLNEFKLTLIISEKLGAFYLQILSSESKMI